MSLQKQLDELKKRLTKELSPEVLEALNDANQKTLMMYLEDKALKKGDQAPDTFFYDEDMKKVFIRDLLQDRHLVISFFRGTWCPYCNLELKALADVNDDIAARGGELISASPELYSFTHTHKSSQGLHFKILTDLNNVAASMFGLVFELPLELREVYRQISLDLEIRNGDSSWLLPMPATFVINKNGIIVSTFVNADYTKRMEPEDILAQLDAINA